MSEYQYYEFTAIDRPLTRTEMAELRAVSSRASISPNRFVNHYEWGDLKADPADWMRRFFDAFVYWANWCSCRFALRLPLAAFGKMELKPYTAEYAFTVDSGGEHWVLDWALNESEDYDRFGEDDGSGWMGRLVPLRDELLRGDRRPLYLGWLAGACELPDGAMEPEVPPGLAELSPAQQALAEFLEIDADMLAAASVGSTRTPPAEGDEDEHLDGWLEGWTRDEAVAVLKLLVQRRSQEAERRVRSRHAAWRKTQRPAASAAPMRSVAMLRELAETASAARLEQEAKKRSQERAEHQRQREAQLRQIMAEADKHWAVADAQAKRGSASGYEDAVRMVRELADGYALTSSAKEFERALRRFRERHATRGALLRRLKEAGLWAE
jgi:hypothetical protein